MPSFDISSEVDLQEVDNAINQVLKEIATRYDFRGSKTKVTFDKTQKTITIFAEDDMKLKATLEMTHQKLAKRGISLKALKQGKTEDATGMGKRVVITLIMGIETEKGKEITKALKESKLKVQAQIQDEKVRVTGKKRDDLQDAIAFLKTQDLELPLQFDNFRD